MNKQYIKDGGSKKIGTRNSKTPLPIGRVEAIFDLILHRKEPGKPLKISEVISKVTSILKGK